MTKYYKKLLVTPSNSYGVPIRNSWKPKGVVIHNDAGSVSATAKWYANSYLPNLVNNGQIGRGIAHYYGDADNVIQIIDTRMWSYAQGSPAANEPYVSYEVCQSMGASKERFLANEQAVFKQVAEDLKYWGLKPNRNTVRLHQEFYSTACPHRSMELHGNNINKVKDYFISQIKKYMDGKEPEDNKPKIDTYYHSERIKELIIKHDCNIYDGVAFSKSKKLAEAEVGKEYKVVDVWYKGTKPTDISRYKVEYNKGKFGWITGNQYYVSSSHYLNKSYDNKTKIKALKSCNAYADKDFKKDIGNIKKGEVFTVIDNVSSSAGTPRFKLKSGTFVTARKKYWKFV